MNATETMKRITAAETRLRTLNEWVPVLRQRRDEILLALDPSDTSPRHERMKGALNEVLHGWQGGERLVGGAVGDGFARRLPGLEASEDEVKQLQAQLRLLTESLPSAEAIAQARARAEALADQAHELRAEFQGSWESVLGHLSDAAEEARRVTGARSTYRTLVSEARREAEEYALDLDLPALSGHTDPGLKDERSEPLALALHALIEDVLRGAWEAGHLRLSAVEDERRRLARSDARAAAA